MEILSRGLRLKVDVDMRRTYTTHYSHIADKS